MSRTIRLWIGAALLLGALMAVIAGSDSKLRVLEVTGGPAQHLLYLPNGKYLRLVSLGNAAVLADLVYLWSIQYYGNFQIADRYTYVQHIYGNVITELDPHYFDPYWIGALILSVETQDLDRALALFDKGFARNPDDPKRWLFPYLAGWECASAKKYDRAIEYFRIAAAVPSAPPDITRLVAGMYQKEGNPRTALAEWLRIGKETTDASVRKVAENRVRALSIEVDLAQLREALATYRAAHGRTPARLSDLVGAGLLRAVPEDPDGNPYAYDPASGTVGAGSARVIAQ